LFPQNAVDLGVLKNPLLIWVFRKIEALGYRSASKITLHSAGNREHILRQFPNIENKLSILHNWVDISHHECSSESIDFRKRFGIQQKNIALFAGVMGPSQHLELVLNIAEKMKAQDEWLFLFVGDGAEKDRLRKIARSKKLNNVCFKGFVSRDEYPDLLRICSCGLVCLSPLNKTPVVPGKILGYMAAGLPVVAFLHPNSDGHGIIRNAGCGVSADSGDEAACEKIMRCFMQDKLDLDALARRGKKYVASNFSKEICVDQLEELLEE
jgi:glycosyltransferase involved in cell wall biosynthesis